MTQTLIPRSEPYPQDVQEMLEKYPKVDGVLLLLFRTFAQSPRFLRKCVPNLLDADSPLSLQERELVILRVTANLGCEYEWGVHVSVFAEAARLDALQVEMTRKGEPSSTCWSKEQGLLLEVVDQLTSGGRLDAETLKRFREHWTLEQQLEVFALCGTYTTVSLVANQTEMPLEQFAARFPAA